MSSTSLITRQLDLTAVFNEQKKHQWAVRESSADERIGKLKKLHKSVLDHQEDIRKALWSDLRKSPTEVDITEISTVTSEIRYIQRHIRAWMAPKRVASPIALTGASSTILHEPKGVCLIIAPWNFPVNLTLIPLASAVAAGNCVVLKPSEHAPASAEVLRRIIEEVFPPEEVCMVEGDADVAQELLRLPFNHIFFTGSPHIGKLVMEAASRHLSSVTLELGGKNPVVVDETADLDRAASQLAWFNGMNAGQSCVEPDYVLVHSSVHDVLVHKTAEAIKQQYGASPEDRKRSPDLCRLIHQRHFERTQHFVEDAVQKGAILQFGGQFDASGRYAEPTILTSVPDDADLWQDEMFAPVLTFKKYDHPEEALGWIRSIPRPLALYVFSKNKKNINTIIRGTRAGTTAVNDIALQFYNPNLPFGGINNSGMGKGHGQFAFQEFSNARSIVRQNNLLAATTFFKPPYDKHPAWVKALIKALTRWL